MSTQLDLTRTKFVQTDSKRHDELDPTRLWHERMGHIGVGRLRAMQRKGMVEYFPECGLEFEFCENFIYGKQSRVRLPYGEARENGILELVHNDVLGPVTVPSLGGYMYYVSFIDYFSRKTWIYFLRNKSEVFERFKDFKTLVENQTEKRIKVLRTDNGGEFRGKEFYHFSKQCGIARKNTKPYTPQENGVDERMNETLMDKASNMLSGVGLVQELWAEAVETARYMVNMSHSSALVNTNPNEVWSSKNSSVAHLKVFGCDAFLHVPKEKRSKMDKKAVKCIFIGYREGMKGYKLWDPASRRTMYNRDVVFREVRGKSESEKFVQTENNPDTVWFELRNTEDDSDELTESEEEVEQHNPVVRRSKRVRKPIERYSLPNFLSKFVLTSIDDKPKSVGEVVDSIKGKLWKDSMVEEMESLYKNETWDLVKLPSGRKPFGSKWVFKKNMNVTGQVEKFKA
jgi:transposase InsO family protein